MSVTLALIPVAIAVAGAVSTRKQGREESPRGFRLETRMKDEELLRTALERYGCKNVVKDESVDAAWGETRMLFERDERGVFHAVFTKDISAENATSFLTELDAEYALLVQENVYRNLISRANEKGLIVESDEILEDNSVVITLRV